MINITGSERVFASVHRGIVALAVALVVGGCGADSAAEQDAAGDQGAEYRAMQTGYRGIALAEPLDKPQFTFTDTDGKPFDFRAETDGYVTLLFFGYTHCPDVCPLHMANIAAVLEDLPGDVRNRVKTVFVTTDPERDTPERIRAWLDEFDPSFIGLTASHDKVNRVQAVLGLPPAVKQGPGERKKSQHGDYVVGHATQVIAFSSDGRARLVYPFGTRQADWAHDLPKLVRARGEAL